MDGDVDGYFVGGVRLALTHTGKLPIKKHNLQEEQAKKKQNYMFSLPIWYLSIIVLSE